MRQHELESETAGQERAAQCRRCKRHTLRTTASRSAGIGPRCAAIEAALAGLKPEQQAKALEAVADHAVQRTGHQGVFAVSSSKGDAAYLVSVKGPCNCSNGAAPDDRQAVLARRRCKAHRASAGAVLYGEGGIGMARLNERNVSRILANGAAAFATTSRYDGVSAVAVDPDGMVRSVLDIAPGCHTFALAVETGGRAMNLLYPYTSGGLCIHGLVKRERACGSDLSATCGCGVEPVTANPVRRA